MSTGIGEAPTQTPPIPEQRTGEHESNPNTDQNQDRLIGEFIVSHLLAEVTEPNRQSFIDSLSKIDPRINTVDALTQLIEIMAELSSVDANIEEINEYIRAKFIDYANQYQREDGRFKVPLIIEEVIDPITEQYPNSAIIRAIQDALKAHESTALREAQRLGAFIVLNSKMIQNSDKI